jgi:site-specific recombinase XerD
MNVELSKWIMKAKITKSITFHCARHTFAVLQMTLGTELYTLQKLLGHSQIQTTQIYAKIIDEKKRDVLYFPFLDLYKFQSYDALKVMKPL